MQKNYIHLVAICFTGLGLHNGYRGDSWFRYRIEIFKRYTLASLMNQTNQDFVIWLQFRPQEEKNPLTKGLAICMRNLGCKYVFTFGGVTIWDDKHKEDKLLDRLRFTLPGLKESIGDKEWVYMTNIASDDMYRDDVIEEAQQQEPEYKKAFGYPKGYILNAGTHDIAEYNPATHAPFYTIIFPREVFLNPVKHFNYIGPFHSHEEIPSKFKYTKLEGRKYCVLVHGENISTVWNLPIKGREIIDGEVMAEKFVALKRFGIDPYSKPMKIRNSTRLKLRHILNYIPFRGLIKKIYDKQNIIKL